MKKYRIGLVGFAHMHVLDQIKPFLSMPERVEWIGASDIKPMVESEYFESSSRSMNLKLCQEQCGLPACLRITVIFSISNPTLSL